MSRPRALTFGDDPEQYDRARPGYPDALIDDLVGPGVERVLDVGCGTGKAGRPFAGRGCSVFGVEPDERMATVARRHGLTVDVATFEEWDPAGRRFDLVISGQAWHWVDPDVGPRKAADVLDPGGRLALFWNRPSYEPAVRADLDRVYESLAPELARDSAALGTVDPARHTADIDAIVAGRRFQQPELRSYPWSQTYTTAQYLDQLGTHSDHRLLSETVRAGLFEAVAGVIDQHGGAIRVDYTTLLILTAVEEGT